MQVKVLQNAPRHSVILSAFIKLPFAIKTFVLSIYEWLLKTGFTVYGYQKKNSPTKYAFLKAFNRFCSGFIFCTFGLNIFIQPCLYILIYTIYTNKVRIRMKACSLYSSSPAYISSDYYSKIEQSNAI